MRIVRRQSCSQIEQRDNDRERGRERERGNECMCDRMETFHTSFESAEIEDCTTIMRVY